MRLELMCDREKSNYGRRWNQTVEVQLKAFQMMRDQQGHIMKVSEGFWKLVPNIFL